MIWHDINLIIIDSESFKRDLRSVVELSFTETHKLLRKTHEADILKAQQEKYDDNDEVNHSIRWQVEAHLETQFEDDSRIVATMTLAAIASLTESYLKTLKSWFDKKRPPNAAGYKGEGALAKLVSEYAARFQINLDTLAGFSMVREVVFARNALIHQAGHIEDENYLKFGPTLIDESGRVNLSPEQCSGVLKQVELFADELATTLTELR